MKLQSNWSVMCIWVEQQLGAKILIMCLYLSLSALHVSDSLVHHQERRFGAVYRNWYKPVRLAVSQTYRLIAIRCTVHTTSNELVRTLSLSLSGNFWLRCALCFLWIPVSRTQICWPSFKVKSVVMKADPRCVRSSAWNEVRLLGLNQAPFHSQ